MGSIDNIVAVGHVEETNSLTLHRTLLGELNYRVVIEIAFNDNAPFPLPNEDIGASLVGHVNWILCCLAKILCHI